MTDAAFMLDTNICIYVLADAEGSAATRLGDLRMGEAVVSSITYAEIVRRISPDDRENMKVIHALFASVPILPFDRDAALAYQRIPFRRGGFDRLIAAHALALGLTVVTNNETDFVDVPGLRVANWAS